MKVHDDSELRSRLALEGAEANQRSGAGDP